MARWPAAWALVRIGEPVVPEILIARMGKPAADNELRVFAYVIRGLYDSQGEQEVGMLRMERMLQRARAERKRVVQRYGTKDEPSQWETNLTRFIEIYRNVKPHDQQDWPHPPR